MQGTVPVTGMTVYASGSEYLDGPTPSEQAAGMVPLDTVPADWWNMMFQNLTTQLNNTVTAFNQIYSELLYVITSTGGTPSESDTTQLYQALNSLRQTSTGTADAAGSVKSSSTSGKVSIDANGIMTPNGMGVPTSLNTTSKEIVGAVNELKQALADLNDALRNAITDACNARAPTSHAAADTTYGAGTGSNYGHVKLSAATNSSSGEADSIAATPSAVKAVADDLSSYKTSNATALSGKAPTSHASSATTYGKGDASNYGHVKLSSETGNTSGVADGIAATPLAVKSVADSLATYKTANDRAVANTAPKSHASTGITYGVGSNTNFGHVKLSDSTSLDSGTLGGVAATPAAVKDAYDLANGKAAVGNTAGAALASNASAGSSSAAARADHVHPFPTLVSNNGTRCKVNFVLSGTTLNITTTNV